jgi:hypothetical protein
MTTFSALSAQQLRRAAQVQEQIESLQAELNQILRGEVPTPSLTPAAVLVPAQPKRKMSAAGRAAIAAAARARWAKLRAERKPVAVAQQPTRKISAAGRARLAALAKARWANVKRAGKKSL